MVCFPDRSWSVFQIHQKESYIFVVKFFFSLGIEVKLLIQAPHECDLLWHKSNSHLGFQKQKVISG